MADDLEPFAGRGRRHTLQAATKGPASDGLADERRQAEEGRARREQFRGVGQRFEQGHAHDRMGRCERGRWRLEREREANRNDETGDQGGEHEDSVPFPHFGERVYQAMCHEYFFGAAAKSFRKSDSCELSRSECSEARKKFSQLGSLSRTAASMCYAHAEIFG